MATLRDIATRANVSTSTVSRVLNDYPHVDDKTRTAVREIAEELGYALTNGRRIAPATRRVLLLAREDDLQDQPSVNPMARDLERAVSAGAQSIFEQLGITALLQRTQMEPEQATMYAHNPNIGGLLVLGGIVNRGFVHNLQQLGVPFVIAGGHVLPLYVNCVMADVARGAEQAVEHLVSTGRRRIDLVNGPTTTATSHERLKGFHFALAQHNLPFHPDQVTAGEFRAESGHSQTQSLLAQCPDLDAILYADDAMAMGGLRALKEQGRQVPGDVAVVGFYDYDLARFTDPPLTSQHINMHQLGSIAARRLAMMIDTPDREDWFVLVETTLVVRDST